MARKAVNCAVSIALALAGINVFGQTPGALDRTLEASAKSSPHRTRIILLLEQLADQARASENLAFAVRAQSHAAALLWPLDPEQARAIYRRAFGSLQRPSSELQNGSSKDDRAAVSESVAKPQSRQLSRELLSQIASRDPELAEQLARNLIESSEITSVDSTHDPASNATNPPAPEQPQTPVRDSSERRELLMSAAFQIVDRDPQQAMAFAQMSLALGVSPNFARLLTMLRNVDHERADLLFSNALERLQQTERPALADIHTLGAYVLTTVNSPASRPLSKALVVRFLNFGIDQITQRDVYYLARAGDESTVYFISRQLTELATQYQIDRLGELQRYLIGAGYESTCEEAIDPGLLEVSAPSDITRDAREATDASQRNALYARAALAWLGQADLKEAQAAALKITEGATRDRVLIQIARGYVSEGKSEDALLVVRRIGDIVARVDGLVLLGANASASKDRARAVELLSEAEDGILKASPTIDRARALVKIANSFSRLDPMRTFNALESAVAAINEIIRQQDSKETSSQAAPPSKLEELVSAGFEDALTTLAAADFDRALLLAQQLDGEEAPVLAQLAVLRGGLVEKQTSEAVVGAQESEGGNQ
jgi:hypothetical protein